MALLKGQKQMGRVIMKSLNEKNPYVPFRDLKLLKHCSSVGDEVIFMQSALWKISVAVQHYNITVSQLSC